MNLKIAKIFFGLLFASCSLSNSSSKISKNESVYAITLKSGEFESIHKVLTVHFPDFPKNNTNKKIRYQNDEANAKFKVSLSYTNLKIVFHSVNNSNHKLNTIKSKIEDIRK